ncbi:MAG: hypothetical protein KatS3mg090_0455 [Patescibacteria group bacterium]|nr:MAG: hypothetical protein KatS3mg090_0455 [Patescibacteria group bacterium]
MFYSDALLEKVAYVFKEGYSLVTDFGRNPLVLPYIVVNSFLKRLDKSDDLDLFLSVLLKQRLSKVLANESAVSFVTSAASPHTLETISFDNKNLPAHFIVWWMQTKNKSKKVEDFKRLDFIRLSRSSVKQNKQTIELIAKNIAFCVYAFMTSNKQIRFFNDRRILSEHLFIYGLIGHSLPGSRSKYGFSRGAQSSPEGHLNIVFHNFKKYAKLAVLKKPEVDEWLKHLGPIDTVVYNLFRLEISEINALIMQSLGYQNFSVGFDKNWQILDSKRKISFFEGFYICFDKRLEVSEVLFILSRLVKVYDGLYRLLGKYFCKYYKSFNLVKQQVAIRSEFVDEVAMYLFDLGGKSLKRNWRQSAEKFVDFALSFVPTFLQVKHWSKNSTLNRQNLQLLFKIYSDEKQRLTVRSYQNKLIKQFMNRYDLDKTSASALLRMKLDLYKDETDWKSIQFTLPEKISLSYLISDYVYKKGKVYAGKLSIAPRLMTQKGVFEDLAGTVILRETGL